MGISLKDVKDFATTAVVCSLSPAFCLISAFSGCESSKSSSLPSMPEPKPVQKNPIDEYVSKCDGAAKRMSEVPACGQFPSQLQVKEYPSSTSVYVPPDDGQRNVNQLTSNGKCVIKCAWWTPDQPKYNEVSGLCEYLLVMPQENITYRSGGPYVYETTVTTEKSKGNAYEYFDYCLGKGYLP